jgi:hypothetical protein
LEKYLEIKIMFLIFVSSNKQKKCLIIFITILIFFTMTAQLSQSTTDITTLIEKFSKELPLRQAEGSWAGSAYIDVKLSQGDRSSLIVNSWREWSKNGKWSGNSSRHILNLVEGDTFATIGGLLTIYKERDNLTACPCLWYEQSRGFEVKEKK